MNPETTTPENNLTFVFIYTKRAHDFVNEIFAQHPIKSIEVEGEFKNGGEFNRCFVLDKLTFDRFFKELPLKHMLRSDSEYDWAFYDTRTTEATPEPYKEQETVMLAHNAQYLASLNETEQSPE